MIVGVKVSELPEDTSPTSDDYVPAVDNATHATKKVTMVNLVAASPSTGTGAIVRADSPTFTGHPVVPTPTSATDPVTKAYADALAQGLNVKLSVRVATTANITLSGAQTIDGVSAIAGDRVLVKNQSTGANNGIYVVASGAWSRATDADISAEVTSGMFTFVTEGTVSAGVGYVLVTVNPITLGSTTLVFTQFSGAGTILAGHALTKTGSTLAVDETALTGIAQSSVTNLTSSLATKTDTTTLTTKGDIYAATAASTPARLGVGTDGQSIVADSTQTTGLKWVNVSGSGDMVLANTQTVTGAKTFNVGAFLDKGNEVFNLKAYGVVGDGTTDDTTNAQAAYAAITAAGGGIALWPKPTSYYKLTAPIVVTSNTQSIGVVPATDIRGSGSPSLGGGVFNVSGSNIVFKNLKITASGATTMITSYGHDNLLIRDCEFTGTSNTGFPGAIFFDGSDAAGSFTDSFIENNRFHDIPSLSPIHLYPKSGHIVDGIYIRGNKFDTVLGPAINLDAYDIIKNVEVTAGNSFVDVQGGGTVTTPGVALSTKIDTHYEIDGLQFNGNYYRNTLSGGIQSQGLIYIYGTSNFQVCGNVATGSWDEATDTIGPCIALGRTNTPVLNGVISDNIIKGFDAPWDPDSMRNVDVHDNQVYRCGGSWDLGYNIQDYIRVHNNTSYNSPSRGAYTAGFILGNGSQYKCEVYDNVFIDDRPIITPASVTISVSSGGSLTASTTYYYKVTALDDTGETLPSSEVSGLTTSLNKTISLQWNATAGAVSYKVYRSTTSGIYTSPALIATVTGNTFIDYGTNTIASGTVPGGSTVATSVMTRGFVSTGHSGYDHSKVQVRNNRFFLPNGTLTALGYAEYSDSTLPNIMQGNELHDSAGIRFDDIFTSGSIKIISAFGTANRIPTMTSNTTPSGVASASTEANSLNEAWYAMQGSTSLKWTASATTGYIQYDFGASNAKFITSYGVGGAIGGQTTMSPKTWTLQGSNNGSSFTVLDTQTNASAFGNSELRTYSFTNYTAYRYYRMDITLNQGHGTNLSMTQFILTGGYITSQLSPDGTASFGNIVSASRFSGPVTALKSATTEVDVSAATAPTSTQVLTATSASTATWQTPTAGTVTTMSIVSANGLAGTVATATTTPAVTLSTSITGLLKGNGTAISAASAGADYYNPGGTDVAIVDGGTGASTASAGFNALSPMTTAGDIVYGGTSGAGTRLSAGTSSQLLIGGTTPSWGAVTLTSMVTGTLPVANGGTGVTASTGSGNNVLSASPTLTGTTLIASATISGQINYTADPASTNGARTLYSSGLFFDSRVASSTNGISFRTDTTTGQSEALRIEGSGWVYTDANVSGTTISSHQGLGFGWNKTSGDGDSVVMYNTAAGANPRLAFSSYTGSVYAEEMSLKAGKLGIGQTAPTAVLHLKAGTTAASTAPLKFTSGTLQTTAEAGAVEFLTDVFYGTITTGAARKTFAFLESPSFTTPVLGAATATTVAIKAGTSTGNIAKVGGTIFDHFVDTTVGGAEADIYTDTLPANIFATNGDKVTASYGGNFVTVGTELTQLKTVFAGTTIWDSTGVAPSTGTTSWRVVAELIRVSSTVVRYVVSLNTSGASGFVYCTSGELTGLTLSGTNILKVTGTSSGVGSGSGDIVGKQGFVQWLSAA